MVTVRLRIAFCFLACLIAGTISGANILNQSKCIDFLNFDGQMEQEEACAFINKSLESHGDLGVYGDISMGLDSLSKMFYIRIEKIKGGFALELVPHSHQGHGFNFQVNWKSGKIENLIVETLVPATAIEDSI